MVLLSFVSTCALALAPQTQVVTPLPRPAHPLRPPRERFPTPISNATLPLGLPASSQFGRSVAAIGDLDGNGIGDLVVGAPTEPGSTRGAVYVVFLRGNRTALGYQRIAPLSSAGSNSWFGWAVCGLGDLNGDGAVDFAVSDPLNNWVWVVFLRNDGTVDHSVRITDALPTGFGIFDSYGEGLADMGDANGDGTHDIAIVCGTGPGSDGFSPKVFNVGLNPEAAVLGYFKNSLNTTCVAGGSLPDLDGNGVREMAVGFAYAGPPRAQLWGVGPGGAFIGLPRTYTRSSGISGTIPFGIAIAEAGDLDHNGVVDVAIGDAQSYWLLTLDPDSLELTRERITGPQGIPGYVQAGDGFGTALAFLGDIDGDGHDEFAIGAPGDDDGALNSGTVWIASVR